MTASPITRLKHDLYHSMIHTMSKIITTNLRLPVEQLQQYRTIAAELDMSFNELVKRLLVWSSKNPQAIQSIQQQQRDPIWDLPKLARPFTPSDQVEWNEDDRIVYDL